MPDEPTHYRVTVKQAFVAWSCTFFPGQTYTVKKRVFDSMVDDTLFKDLCATFEPVTLPR